MFSGIVNTFKQAAQASFGSNNQWPTNLLHYVDNDNVVTPVNDVMMPDIDLALKVNEESIKKLTGNRPDISQKEFAVFGQKHCDYHEVAKALEDSGYEVKMWNDQNLLQEKDGIKGVELSHLNPVRQKCEDFTVNHALGNLQKEQNSEPKNLQLFVIDKEDNPYPMTAETVVSSRRSDITSGEMRRVAKLEEQFAELNPVVTATVKCVKTGKNQAGEILLNEITCPHRTVGWSKETDIHRYNKMVSFGMEQKKQKSTFREQTNRNIDLLMKGKQEL